MIRKRQSWVGVSLVFWRTGDTKYLESAHAKILYEIKKGEAAWNKNQSITYRRLPRKCR